MNEYFKKKKKFYLPFKIIIIVSVLLAIIFLFYNYLIDHGEIDRRDAYGNTPLMEAVKLSDYRRVENLINKGADVNIPDYDGNTTFLIALHSNDKQIASMLFNNGADINVLDQNGNTPLMLALKSDFFGLAVEIIKAGADVNIINNLGQHPLTVALEKGSSELVSLLLDVGSDKVVKLLEDMPVGSIVKDINAKWRFRSGKNYAGKTIREDYIEWILVSHEHFGEDRTLLLTNELVALHEFDGSYSLVGGRDSWHGSRIRSWIINDFYPQLSEEFRDAIIPTLTNTGNIIIPDEKVFLLSQVELDLGRRNIVGNHGEVIDYFRIPGTRSAIFDDYTWYYWTRSAEAFVDEDHVGEYYKQRYRVQYVSPGGDLSSEYPLMTAGGIRPAVNIYSKTLVTNYKINGTYNIVWAKSDLASKFF